MPLHTVRLELARNPGFPEGSARHGYELRAPLDDEGRFDAAIWLAHKDDCRVRRFWPGEEDRFGSLAHHRGHHWAFHYDDEAALPEEPIFRFDRHVFREGEYVSITEHDGVMRTFRVARVD
jgi:hypothetical protein